MIKKSKEIRIVFAKIVFNFINEEASLFSFFSCWLRSCLPKVLTDLNVISRPHLFFILKEKKNIQVQKVSKGEVATVQFFCWYMLHCTWLPKYQLPSIWVMVYVPSIWAASHRNEIIYQYILVHWFNMALAGSCLQVVVALVIHEGYV